jgi:acyl-CoA dehydrogenase
VALLTLGGALKRKEMLSARLGDVLAELYFLSAALKRWEDEGREDADYPLLAYVMKTGFTRIEAALDDVFYNLPNRTAGWLLQVAVLPFGPVHRGPSDQLVRDCAEILLAPSPTRDRLVQGVFLGGGDTAINRLLDAFELTVKTQGLHDRLHKARIRDWREARDRGFIDDEDIRALEAADAAVAKAIAVDDFAPEELIRRHAAHTIADDAEAAGASPPVANGHAKSVPPSAH